MDKTHIIVQKRVLFPLSKGQVASKSLVQRFLLCPAQTGFSTNSNPQL